MIAFPTAKINLGLNIVERRPDGYHNIETVFLPVPGVSDVLEIVPSTSGETTLHTYGNPVDCPVEKNLVMRAYALLASQHELPALDIHLYKHIPDGAGLGGGSSDAAATLVTINSMLELGLSTEQLASLAARLGADCAFFVHGRPMMATGIGDVLTPVEVNLKGKCLLLVKPPVGVSTAQAYARVTPEPSTLRPDEVVQWPLPMWDGALKNDFEPSVFAQYPLLWHIKAMLLDAGAQYAAMSGSGSTMFAVFDTDEMAERAADKFADCVTFVTLL